MTQSTTSPRIGVISLGCPKASVDTEQILTRLRAEGYELSSSYDNADLVAARTSGAASKAKLLPVVARSQRNAPMLRSRFALFLLDGASLGQHLKSIDQLVKGKIG